MIASRLFVILTPHARKTELKRPSQANETMSAAEILSGNITASITICKRNEYRL